MEDANATVVPVVHYGLGPIGVEVARLTATRRQLRSLLAVEIDERLVGRPLEALTRMPAHAGVLVGASLPPPPPGTTPVVLHCTGSALEHVLPQLLDCVASGYHVVSTCEELSYPWRFLPEAAGRLHELALEHGVTVLGTGINPGFAMDYLPVTLTGACQVVDHIAVHRRQNAALRRLPLQRKVGAGLTVEEFELARAEGRVGVVGLSASVWSIASALGWRLSRVNESLEPVTAPQEVSSGLGRSRLVGSLVSSRWPVGSMRPRSGSASRSRSRWAPATSATRCRSAGVPDLAVTVPGGFPGDLATAAVVVNSVLQVAGARPGLLPCSTCRRRGRREAHPRTRPGSGSGSGRGAGIG